MRSFTCLVAVLAVTPLTRVTAQEPPPVKVGDRVRVSHDCTYRGTRKRCQEDKGSLARLTGDSLVLTIDNRETSLAVSLASVTRLQLSRGRKSKIVTGAAVGLLVGAPRALSTATSYGRGPISVG